MTRPNVFGVPPGADFPAEVARELIRRHEGAPPEAIARVELIVTTARMKRRMIDAFSAAGDGFLPRIRLIDELAALAPARAAPPVSKLRRRLELVRLVTALMAHEPDFAPGAGVFGLADSLARLLAEMQDEAVPPERLHTLDVAADHAAHWQRSLRFLQIVTGFFASDAAPDTSGLLRRAIEALVSDWPSAPPDHPVILAGSTGSRGTTALLMEAIARLPNGAVVLPGFDFDMTEGAWNSLCSGPTPQEDHPQFRFARLANALGIAPSDIRPWGAATAPDPARNRLVSLALSPAPITDRWITEGAALGDLRAATSNVTRIVAPDPRAEALAIAAALREAAETGTPAMLVTPDRVLARRVTAALDRWRIVPDDSAGQPLALSPPGRFLRQVAALFTETVTVDRLLALLKQPLAASGGAGRGDHLRFTRDLELVLRRKGPQFPQGADLLRWAAESGDAARQNWAAWLGGALDRTADIGMAPLSDWVGLFAAVADALAAGPDGDARDSELWREAAGIEAARLMALLRQEAAYGGSVTAAQFTDLLTTLLQDGSARATETAHPLISIRGTLEARVGGARRVILGGLNEGVWPGALSPDPWLSRQMRLAAGLLLPERQIGLSAHDFQQAIAAPEVFLTRATRDSEAETVPSRWLQRLENLMAGLPVQNGPDALAQMTARGQRWLDLAAAIDAPTEKLTPARRPAPRPPVDKRPKTLAVTGVRTLVRDPYAIYARHILRLFPLDPLRAGPDARLRGQVLHQIVEAFVRGHPEAETEEEAVARLLSVAEQKLGDLIPWHATRRLWLARLRRLAHWFVRTEAARRATGLPVVMEDKGGALTPDGFKLTARPDRIDLLDDGTVRIFDYKTGSPPTPEDIRTFDKQLHLEACLTERGAFAELGPRPVSSVAHLHLGGSGAEKLRPLEPGEADTIWAEFLTLLAAYGRHDTGYASRRLVKPNSPPGDYDHLARFGEWDMTDPPEPEDVP